MAEKLLSAREAARILNISELAIHRLLRQHNAPKQLGVYALPVSFVEKLKRQRGATAKARGAA